MRSTKTDGDPSRIDILFKGVTLLDLPTTLEGLNITRAGCYELSGSNWRGRVVAVGCWIAEDDRDYFDPSPFAASFP